jgi:hypothetical protein
MNDLFPDWVSGDTYFFGKLRTLSGFQDMDAIDYSLAYFMERSEKLAGPVALRFHEDSEKIAELLWLRYGESWKHFHELITLEYNPIENYNRDEQTSDLKEFTNKTDREINATSDSENLRTPYLVYEDNETRTPDLTHTTEITNTRTPNLTTTNTNTQNTTNSTSAYDSSTFVNRDKTEVSVSGSQNQTGTETTKNTDTQKETGTEKRTNHRSETGNEKIVNETETAQSENVNNTGDESFTRVSVIKGNIGVTTTQQMMQQEIEFWKWNFQEQMFHDIDKMLCLEIY